MNRHVECSYCGNAVSIEEELKRARVEAGVWQKDAEDWKVRCVKAERDAELLKNNLKEVYELAKLAHAIE